MPFDRLGPLSRLNRRTFLTRAGWTGLGATCTTRMPPQRLSSSSTSASERPAARAVSR